MDKDIISARIEAINNEMTQLKANYAKLEGHFAECQHWMMEIIKKETEAQVQADKEIIDGQVNDESAGKAPGEGFCGAEAA